MSAILVANVAAYSIQLAALVVSALLAAALVRLRDPRPAFYFWQAIFVVTLALPFFRHSTTPVADLWMGSATTAARALVEPSLSLSASDAAVLALLVLVTVAAARLIWLVVGLVKLCGIRYRSHPVSLPSVLDALAERLGVSAEIRLSTEVDSPVTIGLRCPLVLLPPRALALPVPVQQAILIHELIHVRRRDWLFTVVEQLWAALLWFHPAARVLMSQIALMREALVDQETLALTGDRRSYAQALLTFAEPAMPAPAGVPSLIRPRHLTQRIALISQESPMSLRHVIAALIVGTTIVGSVTAAGVSRFPIVISQREGAAPAASARAPQQEEPVRPGNGVTLPQVIEEVRPNYTPAALQAKIQGEVEMDLVVQANGEPGPATITKSLDTVYGLDEAAMGAASLWRFEPGRRNGEPVPVIITLQMRFTLK